jgi:TonB-dependent starch-binding outer membrane protein SusC
MFQRGMKTATWIFGLFALLMHGSPLFSQDNGKVELSGTVTSENGESLVGVNLVVMNTLNGTITDIDGNYSLTVNADDTLTVSFIGFDVQEIPVNGRSVIDVVLKESITDLDEIVVVGYGEVKRANLVGSVSSLQAKEIEDFPVTNLTNLLDGRMAGVSVSPAQPTGNPGASTRIRIRAETTFGSAGEGAKDPSPLYIVDGFVVSQSTYDMIDPSDIESFSVLKDASAAVYGSKGANGVILVKTKRGREGKLRISYSGSYGIMDATTQTEMLSAYDHARAINARYIEPSDSNKWATEKDLEALKNIDFNWLEETWQRSSVSRHTINVSGGSSKVKYYAGGSYVYTEGNFPDMGIGKYTYRLGLDANITDHLQASATIALDNRDFKRPYISGVGSNTMEDLFQELLQAPKWTPAYINGYPVGNNLSFNPLYLFETNSYKRSVDKGNTLNFRLSYDFEKIKGLSASASYSRRESNSYAKDYLIPYDLYLFKHPSEEYHYVLSDEIETIERVENKNRISESYSHGENYQLNLSINYNRVFGNHEISSFFTYEQSEGNSYGFEALTEDIQTYGLELQEAFLTPFTDGNMSESGDMGAVFRLNYFYADKYLLESTFRYETTTLFAPGERAGLFPSVSIGWVATEEKFVKERFSFIDFLKFRFSMGLTGYSSVSPYEYLLKYNLSTSKYLFGTDIPVPGIGIGGKTDVVSSGVTWEKSKMHNVGMDMKFLDSRLSVSMDAYYTYQYDILDKRTVEFAETAGLGDMPGENLGRLEAWGYDGQISYRGNITNELYWNISGNFSFATNRIIERPTEYIPIDFRYPIGQSTYGAGREEGLISHGIIRTQEQLDAINNEWMEKWGHVYWVDGRPAGLGSLLFEDIGRPGNTSAGEPRTVFEPDGVIDEYDKKYLERVGDFFSWKHLLPTDVSLGGGWKDLKISMLFSMAYGIWNQAVDKLARTVPTTSENSPAFWNDFWTPENPNAQYPSPYYATTNQWVSTFWMKDVYQLRLKNLNISYNIPKRISEKWKIPELRIYFVGTNLWSPINTFDYKEDAIARYNTYPLLKTFSFGINLRI